LDAATICIALVIWAVLLTDRMRRRMSRVLGMANYFRQLLLMRYNGAVSRRKPVWRLLSGNGGSIITVPSAVL
jgi:hypothetical protein